VLESFIRWKCPRGYNDEKQPEQLHP